MHVCGIWGVPCRSLVPLLPVWGGLCGCLVLTSDACQRS